MTPYTDEWNKWRAGRRSKMLIERSKARVANQAWATIDRKIGTQFIPRQGDNFRFVRWGGLGDLSLWPAIIQVEIPRIDQGVFDTLHSTMKKAEDETGKYDPKLLWKKP